MRGFTLIEVIITLAIMAIILPATTLFLLQLLQSQGSVQGEVEMEQTSSLLFSELKSEILEASSVTITASTLNSDVGELVFVDNSGATVTIDLVTIGPVRRLRFQRGADPAVYVTPADIDVIVWRIEAVRRDSDERLTGLQFDFDLALLNPDATPYRSVAFQGETTIALSPQTIEL